MHLLGEVSRLLLHERLEQRIGHFPGRIYVYEHSKSKEAKRSETRRGGTFLKEEGEEGVWRQRIRFSSKN